MNQSEANALLSSIVAYAGLADEKNFTLHASEGVHMSATLAAARALKETDKLCGYFQHDQMAKTVMKKDADGWELPERSWVTKYTPTGRSEDVNGVEYMRLVKAFFRSGSVTAKPIAGSPSLAAIQGPIPSGFTGYTNELGTANYSKVGNMRAIISKGTNWQLVTVYPVA